MNTLALDVSASSTGWAIWLDGDIRDHFNSPNWLTALDRFGISRTSRNWRVYDDGKTSLAHGAWQLKSAWSREGEPHAKLHQNLAVLHEHVEFERVFYERALSPEQRGGASNESNDILIELLGHVKSFHFAYHLRQLMGIHRASWQKSYIGSQKRGTKRAVLLDLIEQRSRQLGFTFRKNDEAAAVGILTHGLLISGITPPWLANEVLRPPLGGPKL